MMTLKKIDNDWGVKLYGVWLRARRQALSAGVQWLAPKSANERESWKVPGVPQRVVATEVGMMVAQIDSPIQRNQVALAVKSSGGQLVTSLIVPNGWCGGG
nr:hypothetical protein Iba_chr03bCG4070 [Ipomoea batatas]